MCVTSHIFPDFSFRILFSQKKNREKNGKKIGMSHNHFAEQLYMYFINTVIPLSLNSILWIQI